VDVDDQRLDRPPPAVAAAALDEVAAARRAVSAAERRTLPLVLGTRAFLVLVQHAAGDLVTDRRARWLVSGACVALDALQQAADHGSAAVRPFDVGRDEHPRPPGAPPAVWPVAVLGRVAVERSVVAALRRSRVRWPGTAAGAVLAATTVLGEVAVRRLLSRAGTGA
jgi:hypothetical protein